MTMTEEEWKKVQEHLDLVKQYEPTLLMFQQFIDKSKPKWVKQLEAAGIKVCPSVYMK